MLCVPLTVLALAASAQSGPLLSPQPRAVRGSASLRGEDSTTLLNTQYDTRVLPTAAHAGISPPVHP
jgi:hypothetical protein